jgi:hypothetical protein
MGGQISAPRVSAPALWRRMEEWTLPFGCAPATHPQRTHNAPTENAMHLLVKTMTTSVRTTRHWGRAGVALPAATLLLLAACGGSGLDDSPAATAADTRAAILAAPPITPPLLDDEGQVLPADPAALPSDPLLRLASGRHATPAQARQLEAALGAKAISVKVATSADATADIEGAWLAGLGLQTAHDLDMDAPVLVRGADIQRAAEAARRFEAGGFSRVFLVVQ